MRKNDTNKRLAIYLRVSSDQQTTEMQSADIQKELKKEGIVPVEIYEDAAVSGRTESRVALDRMITDAGKGKFNEVWIWRMDRLARSVRNGLNMLYEIEKHGVNVQVITQPLLNTGAMMSEAIRPLILWAAQQEWESITLRNKTGKMGSIRRNRWLNDPPYGFDKTPDLQLIPNPYQAKIIRKIYYLYVKENMSTRAIAALLNEEGVPPPSLAGRWNRTSKDPQWRKDAVAKYLRNPIYVGSVPIGRKWGKIHDFTCEPLITQELFDLAQEKKVERSTLSKRNNKREYLFRFILKCAGCGLLLFPKAGKQKGEEYINYGYQRSIKWDGKAEKRCGRSCGSISERRLVFNIVSFFRENFFLFVRKQGWQYLIKPILHQPENENYQELVKQYSEELKTLGEKRDLIVDAFLEGILTKEKRDEKLRTMDGKIAATETRLLEARQKTLSQAQQEEQAKEYLEKLKGLTTFLERFKKQEMDIKQSYSFVRELIERKIIESVFVDFKKNTIQIRSPIETDDLKLRLSDPKQIKEENKVWFATEAEAQKAGYTLAGNCQ